eukprot:4874088-Amphidinium_carterae.4
MSARQSLCALSSSEAELITLISGLQLTLGLSVQMIEMLQCDLPITALNDNSAVVSMSQRPLHASSSRTRHLAMKACWLRDLVERHVIKCVHVDTTRKRADSLTKGLRGELSRRHLCMSE